MKPVRLRDGRIPRSRPPRSGRPVALVGVLLLFSACDGFQAETEPDSPASRGQPAAAVAATGATEHRVGPISTAALSRLRQANVRLESALREGDENATAAATQAAEIAIGDLLSPEARSLIRQAALEILDAHPDLATAPHEEAVLWLRTHWRDNLPDGLLPGFGAPDTCSENCGEDFAFDMIAIEVAFVGAIALCPVTGPFVLVCWGAATTTKAASVLAAGVGFNNCLDNCD